MTLRAPLFALFGIALSVSAATQKPVVNSTSNSEPASLEVTPTIEIPGVRTAKNNSIDVQSENKEIEHELEANRTDISKEHRIEQKHAKIEQQHIKRRPPTRQEEPVQQAPQPIPVLPEDDFNPNEFMQALFADAETEGLFNQMLGELDQEFEDSQRTLAQDTRAYEDEFGQNDDFYHPVTETRNSNRVS